MNHAEKNLMLARWLYPYGNWSIANGLVWDFSGPGKDFDISRPRDRSKVIMKLKQDHNITIHERKRQGKTYWEAVSHTQGKGLAESTGRMENQDLGELLYQIVEGLKK